MKKDGTNINISRGGRADNGRCSSVVLYTVLEFDVQRLIVQLQAVVKGSRISHSTSSPALISQSHQAGIIIIIIVI